MVCGILDARHKAEKREGCLRLGTAYVVIPSPCKARDRGRESVHGLDLGPSVDARKCRTIRIMSDDGPS